MQGGPWFRRPHRAAVWSWAIVVIGFVIPLPGMFRGAGSVQDEGMMLVMPLRLLKGDLPNEDFLALYGPGAVHFLAGWYELVGASLAAERLVGCLQLLALVCAGYALSRVYGRVAATSAALTLTLLMLTSTGLAALAWPGAIAMSLWSIVFGLRALQQTGAARTRSLVAAGLLVGLALSYRPDLIVALALAWLFLWRRHHWNWRPFAAAAVGLTPMWVHLALVGLPTAWRGMVTEPIFELRPGRDLPRPPSWRWVDGALQALGEHPNASSWWKLPAMPAPKQMFFWFWLVLLVDIALPVIVWRWSRVRRQVAPRTGSKELTVLMASSLFGLGLVGQALQRPDSTHLAWGSAVSFAMLPAVVVVWLRRSAEGGDRFGVQRRPVLVAAAPAVAIGLLFLAVCPFYTYRSYLVAARVSVGNLPAGHEITRGDRHFYLVAEDLQRSAQGAIDDLDALSKPGDRLVVAPADMRRTVFGELFFYYLFPELEPATYFIEMDPGLANEEGSSLADDVRSADWLVLSNFWTGWYEPNDSVEYGSDEPNRVVAEEFCLVNSYEDGLIMLFRKCAVGDGIDPITIGIGPERVQMMEDAKAAHS